MNNKFPGTNILLKKTTTLVFVLITSLIWGQENSTESKKLCGGFGYLTMSGEQLNLNPLNKALAADGYGQLNSNAASFGGGGAFAVHDFILGGGGAWLMGSGNQNGNNEINIKGGYGFFNAGYIVYAGKHGLLYPTLGIGGGGYDISASKLNSSSDFNQQLTSPTGMLTTQAGGLMASVQVSYHYFFSKSSLQGFYIGLKAGYKYAPVKWNVSVNDKTLSNAPKINMDGAFVTIFLGGGRLFKN